MSSQPLSANQSPERRLGDDIDSASTQKSAVAATFDSAALGQDTKTNKNQGGVQYG
jgi:hypothetical protein